MLIFANPNNPTGTAIGLEQIEALLSAARDTLVVVDEAYFEFCGITALGLLPKYENLIILRTFSKAYGIAGLRLGYAVASKNIIGDISKCASPYNVNSLALIAAEAALKDKRYLAKCIGEVKKGREYLKKELGNLGIETYPAQANFVVARVGPGSKGLVAKLKDKGILIKELGGPLLGGCVRIGVGSPADCKRVMKEMKAIPAGAYGISGDGK
jgi:histidinol-phosphate aminotransferase